MFSAPSQSIAEMADGSVPIVEISRSSADNSPTPPTTTAATDATPPMMVKNYTV